MGTQPRKLPPDEIAKRRRRIVNALRHGVPGKIICQAHCVDRKTVHKIAEEEGLSIPNGGNRYQGVPVP